MAIRFDPKNLSTAGSLPGVKEEILPARAKGEPLLRRRSVSTDERIFFTTQLSLMLEIGTPLASALGAIAKQTQNPAFREILQAMLRDIEEGRQLSDAMKRHPQVFNSIFTSMVRAGETGGYLKKILDSMADMDEKRQALLSQLRSTLTYPAVLCTLAVAVVIFVLVAILPKFAVLFEGKYALMPLSTRFLMAASASLR
ncbi:MAG: type II secretion system F family protein, partial [Deltaproteobacteria bacterium]|nr:type II secretion system F family protein [Deltaproteobacteria bacterium]